MTRPSPSATSLACGTWVAIAAYGIWGLFPIYWKWLEEIPALQLVSHRVLWTCVTLGLVILLSGKWQSFVASFRSGRMMRIYLVAALLMGINWLVFTIAVNSDNVTQTGLGYYISPLINVLMGVLLLRERLRIGQWASVGMAAAGVTYLTVMQGTLPWMALALAFSFGCYGLVKKMAPLDAVNGLMLETSLLLPAALAYLGYCELTGQGAFVHASTGATLLMIASGVVSMSPLLLFALAAQQIPLSRLGILQYLTPTLQLLLGVMVYHEPFDHHSLLGFGLVWTSLLMFSLDGWRASRRNVQE